MDPFGLLSQSSIVGCMGCKVLYKAIDSFLTSDTMQTEVVNAFVEGCKMVMHTETRKNMCEVGGQNLGSTLYPLMIGVVSQDRLCTETLKLCATPIIQELNLQEVVEGILADKPAIIKDDNFINSKYEEIAQSGKDRTVLKAVHLTDVHLDLEYKVGMNADCDDFLCCREEHGLPGPGQEAAGEFGGYHCDVPKQTLDAMLDHILDDIKPDIVFWTGDNSPHNVYDITNEEVTNYTIEVTKMIKAKLDSTDITVIPIHGNHDVWPVDTQSFEKPNDNYPINHFKQYWSDWIDEAALTKFGEFGFYSVDLTLKNGKAVPAGSKIIAYNTNTCDQYNWNLVSQRSDPGKQFEWLSAELKSVEQNGGIAILVGHYGPAACTTEWGTRFRALIERYQHVVRVGLQGHHHSEFFEISNSMTDPSKPILLNSIGGSVTPLSMGKNPSFMTIDIDAETLLPLNMNSVYFDLGKANADGAITWESHDYLEEFKLKDLSPASMLDFAFRLKQDKELAALWEWSMSARSQKTKVAVDDVDQAEDFCRAVTSEHNEWQYCINNSGDKYQTVFGDHSKLSSVYGIVDKLVSNWINVYHLP